MADTKNIKQSEITLQNGEKAQAYEMQPQQTVDIAGNGSIASVSFVDDTGAAGQDHLLITFENGQNIVLWNFVEMAALEDAPLIALPESGTVSSSLLLAQIQQLNEVEPAAGPENNILKAGETTLDVEQQKELLKELNDIEPAAGPDAASAPVSADGGFTPGVDAGNDYLAPDVISTVPLGPGGDAFAGGDQKVPEVFAAAAPAAPALPVAADDAFTATEDLPLTMTTTELLANDDAGLTEISAVDATTASGGTLSFDSVAGTIFYTPVANFNGVDTFTYTATDGAGNTSTATVTINVTGVNDNPDAVNDVVNGVEDTPLVISVLSNDSDVDGDSLVISGTTAPSNGSLLVNTDGTITYTPNANFNGTDSFTYTIRDDNGATDTATVTINVAGTNDAPDAINDAVNAVEDTPLVINVLGNDTDIDGDTLTVSAVSAPANGAVVINADGTITYTPNTNFNGSDSFDYTISDGHGGTDTATVTINVGAGNDRPDAVNDTFTGTEDNQITGTVLTNDTDLDGDTLTVTAHTNPAHGALVINADGTFAYTPAANFHGTDTFTYTVSDGNGGFDTATVTLNVGSVNDDPNARNDRFNGTEDNQITGTVLTNDTDADGDTLTVTAHTNPAHGALVINADGTFTYTPAAGFNGADTFTYTVSDGNGGTDTARVRLNIGSVNDAPDAVNDTFTGTEDNQITGTVLTNDTDVDGDTLTVTAHTNPAHGALVINADGTFTYTPADNFNGTDTFTYTVSDGNGGTDTATVTLNVGAVNDDPNARNDRFNGTEDNPITGTVLTNDTDADGDTLTVTAHTNPAHGALVINADGTFTYTPAAGFNGADTFTYTVSDGNGGFDTATVTLNVGSVNDDPNARNDRFNGTEDNQITGTVLTNDTDVDGDTLTVTAHTNPAHGALVINADGTFTYTPAAGFNGADTFTYTVSDGNGGFDTATVTLNVGSVNDDPNARNDRFNGTEDNQITGTVLTNDTDVDGDTLTVTAHTNPAHGAVVMNADGTFTYTPADNFHGTDTFTYTVSDGNGGTDTARVILNVGSVNDDPNARNDAFTVGEDQDGVQGNLLTNDTDVDGDTLTITAHTNPAHGALVINADGTFAYTPAANFHGTDTFTYTVSDGNGGFDTATVNLTVEAPAPVNHDPVAVNDTMVINYTYHSPGDLPRNSHPRNFSDLYEREGNPNFNVLGNDSDADGDTLQIVSFTQGAHGHVVLNSDGTFTYTPDQTEQPLHAYKYEGSDTFTYTVSDGHGGFDTATVNVEVRVLLSPLVLDLDGDGVEVLSADVSNALFDMDNDGVAENVGWVAPDDGFLVLDRNEDGIINNRSEMFGADENHDEGFSALSELDSNEDGIINAEDAQFGDLQVWQDANGDGATDDGELFTLADLGIESIDLGATEVGEMVNGQFVSHRSTVTFTDGSTGDIDDVWFETHEVEPIANTVTTDNQEEEGAGENTGAETLSLGDVVAAENNIGEIFLDTDGVVHQQNIQDYTPQDVYSSTSSDLGVNDQSAVFMFNSVNIV